MSSLTVEFPEKLRPLLKPARYKAAYGGRGGAKSHFFAELLILRCYSRKTRAVCIREVQNSLKESVRQLLVDKIQKFGLGQFFTVLEAEIRGSNGSLIIFKGMQSYNAESIKSLEGYDIAWVEEAQTLSQTSLDMLRPTIRAEGSEIWFSWNPRHDTDPVDHFFRGGDAPPSSAVVEVNARDNPWLPDELKREMEFDHARDPEKFAHVWGGGYQIITEGAYYAKALAEAENAGRIGDFPFDPALPVQTGWDIGVDDYTAIWFFQENGKQVRAIDYYEASGEGAAEIIEQAIKSKPYRYGAHFLPHDVMVREWGAGAKSRFQTLTELGLRNIRAGVQQGPSERINASRAILPVTYFDRAACSLGIKRLRNYRRRWNEAMQTYSGPLHDESSHGADAFGEFAVNCQIRPKPEARDTRAGDRWDKAFKTEGNGSWKTV